MKTAAAVTRSIAIKSATVNFVGSSEHGRTEIIER